jgi:NAD(P)-dependent dehydrogenase (short-subunit alcohol dehydrogenase family)
VIGLTQSAAVETEAHNIRVNVVAPGVVETPAYGADAKASANELANRVHLIRRAGTSDEVASSVLFLASDEASFITGSTLSVDGGAQLRGQSN